MFLALLIVSCLMPQAPTKVTLERTDRGWQLLRAGQPYFIKGAGGRGRLDDLKSAGGNSIRTWHAGDMGATLDRAHALGMTVTFGIWLKHERHGFDYGDAAAVERQKAKARDIVMKYKDHPALLLWGIGNEMEGDGKNPKVWQAVNDIAAMIKDIDPNHPTMTVIAGVWPDKIRQLNAHCPDIDIVGINAYGVLGAVPEEARRQGLKRPYIVTEFGPTGWWEVDKTSWGVAIEHSSTIKAHTYDLSYGRAIAGEPGVCLGCYAFLWGHKQEHTRTWFGLFLPEGQRTAAIDVLTRRWTGSWPANRCPGIVSVAVGRPEGTTLAVRELTTTPGATHTWSVVASDPDNDTLTYRWELRPESTDKKTGGDREDAPRAIDGVVLETHDNTMQFKAPAQSGQYRVFVYVLDGNGNAATANVPVLVE